MSSMPVELRNLNPLDPSYQAPPYAAVEHQTVQNTDQPPLPSPTIVQPTEVAIGRVVNFQRYRQQVLCKSCQQQVITKTEYRISGGTWCMCCVVFFVGGFVCCFIPFLMKSCKDVVHRCPDCGTVLGRKPLI